MINEMGGVNGRKINLISLDDGYSPPKTSSKSAVWSNRRRSPSSSIAWALPLTQPSGPISTTTRYRKLFVATGATMWGDPQHFPWTIGWQPNYQTEARIFGKHILATNPGAKIGVLYQNDGFGKDYLIGLRAGLSADHVGMIVKEVSYETSEPTVESQVVTCRGRASIHCSSLRRRNSRLRQFAKFSTSAGRPCAI